MFVGARCIGLRRGRGRICESHFFLLFVFHGWIGEGDRKQRKCDGKGETRFADKRHSKVYVSFGGLLLYLEGPYKKLTPLRIDYVYLLIKK